MRRGIALKFATITCDGCKAERLMAQPCADCGAKPRDHETQPDLARRRKLLAEFGNAGPPEVQQFSTDIDMARGEIPALFKDVRQALQRAARPNCRSAQGLIDSFAEFDARVAFWTQRRPRPDTNRGRALGRLLQQLSRGLRVFAEALGAPTMLAAQAMAAEGQGLVDAAWDELDRLDEIDESEALLTSDGLGHVGASARIVAGGDLALEALDQRLQHLFGRDDGQRPLGLGLNLHLFRHLMLVLLDLDECMAVAQLAEAGCGDLRSVCLDSRWQARHGVVTAQFSSATFNLSRIDGDNDLEAAGAALQLVLQCRDGVIRHCLATILATDADDYRRLMTAATGKVILQAARAMPGLRLNENLSPVLRHAAAHMDFDVVDNMFVTHADGTEIRLPVEQFLDQVLGYLQTSVSLLVALLSATSVQALELEISRHTPERDLLASIAMLVGFVGFADVAVERDGTTLRVSGKGEGERFLAAAAGLATIVPESFDRISAQLTDPLGEPRLWEAPLAAYRAYETREPGLTEVDELLALAKLMTSVRIDSEPVWNEDMWAGLGLHIVQLTDGWQLRERILRIREMRKLSLADGQRTVAETLTTILQALRESNQPPAIGSSTPSAFRRASRTVGTPGQGEHQLGRLHAH